MENKVLDKNILFQFIDLNYTKHKVLLNGCKLHRACIITLYLET